MKELTLEARVENLDKVLQFIDEQLEQSDCPLKTQMKIDIAVEEVFVNVASYAYVPGTGPVTVCVEFEQAPKAVIITFTDFGIPYDPMAKDDPDVTLPVQERQIGGLGIFMVKKSMDDMSYRYHNGQNILVIRKNFE